MTKLLLLMPMALSEYFSITHRSRLQLALHGNHTSLHCPLRIGGCINIELKKLIQYNF